MTPVIKCENCDETCGTVDSLGHHISTNHKEELPIAVFDSSRTDTYKETTPAEASEEGNVDPKGEKGDIMKAIPKSTEIRRSEEIHPELSKNLPATANPCPLPIYVEWTVRKDHNMKNILMTSMVTNVSIVPLVL